MMAHIRGVLVTGLCLAGAAAGGHLLYEDLNRSGESGYGDPVGKVEKKESKVKRKSSENYVWNSVEVNENLYRHDSVQTGIGSAASIRLKDGTVLDIGESSLVVMDDTSELSLGYIRGSVVLHKVTGDSKVSVGKDGKSKIEDLSVKLIQPESLAQFVVPEKGSKQVLFAWSLRSAKSTADSYSLQISTEKRFISQVTKSREIGNGSQSSLTVALTAGKYYWRVISKEKVLSETRQFKVQNGLSLQPIWPSDHDKVEVFSPEQSVQFRWLGQKNSGHEDTGTLQGDHRIELSFDPEFKTLIRSDVINPLTGAVILKGVPAGHLYWRLKSSYGDVVALSSKKVFEYKVQAKTIDTQEPMKARKIMAPEIVSPDAGVRFDLLKEKDGIEVSWSEVEGAVGYELIFYFSSNNKVALKTATSKTKLKLNELKAGSYLWTLRALDSQKNPGENIPLRKLTLELPKLLEAPHVFSPEVQ